MAGESSQRIGSIAGFLLHVPHNKPFRTVVL